MPAVTEKKGLPWGLGGTDRENGGRLVASVREVSGWLTGKLHWEAEETDEALVGEEQGLLREQCRGTVCDKEEERTQRAGDPGLPGHGEGGP